ncbi:MAG: hypothetical protein IIC03_04140 [Proteobacteria bacterium]|nr:hypothetical protein [Pseudomonadota bacterium]
MPAAFILLWALWSVLFLPGAIIGLAGGALFGPLWGVPWNLTGPRWAPAWPSWRAWSGACAAAPDPGSGGGGQSCPPYRAARRMLRPD